MANITASIPQLAKVPQCAYPAFEAIAAQGCGLDLGCICGNDNFFVTLSATIAGGTCSLIQAGESLVLTRKICAQAVPWLNANRGPEVVASITVLTVLSTTTVVLRALARKSKNTNFSVDDWLIVVALIWAYGLTITQYISVHLGFGRHILMVDTENIVPFLKTFFCSAVIFGVSATAMKLSILFFYHRIFSIRRFTIASSIIGIVVLAWFISYMAFQFFGCRPLAYQWDKTIPGGHCIDFRHEAYYGTSPPDIATNIAILVLPIPYLWKLQMAAAKKIAITVIFILGSFATIGSIVRIPLFAELKVNDISYSVVKSGIWLSVELNIGIVSACLPLLKPLFSKTFPSTLRSRFTKSRTHTSRYGVGSQRLPDTEQGNRSATMASRTNDVYPGGTKKHKSWYAYNNTATASKNEEERSDNSQENIIPLGKIEVRHDVSWEEGDTLPPSTLGPNPPVYSH